MDPWWWCNKKNEEWSDKKWIIGVPSLSNEKRKIKKNENFAERSQNFGRRDPKMDFHWGEVGEDQKLKYGGEI